MPEAANITSLDALTAFRATMIVYLTKTRPLLEEISSEMVRMRQWLDEDQRRHWEQQFRQRSRKLEEARAELFSAVLSKLQEATSLQQMAVQRAERAVREAEGKLNMLRKWSRELEPKSSPLIKQAEQLQNYLSGDMPKAIAQLDNFIQVLEAYANIKREPSEAGS
jgi:hypothetical protein